MLTYWISANAFWFRYRAGQGLSLVLSEGGIKDGDERDHLMEDDSRDAELLPSYQWLLQDLPRLPLFDSVRGMTANALQQVSRESGLGLFRFIRLSLPYTYLSEYARKIC